MLPALPGPPAVVLVLVTTDATVITHLLLPRWMRPQFALDERGGPCPLGWPTARFATMDITPAPRPWHDADGRWWRSYGNELWESDELGSMRRREASINDVAIDERERRIHGR